MNLEELSGLEESESLFYGIASICEEEFLHRKLLQFLIEKNIQFNIQPSIPWGFPEVKINNLIISTQLHTTQAEHEISIKFNKQYRAFKKLEDATIVILKYINYNR